MVGDNMDEILKIRIPGGLSLELEKIINSDNPKYLNKGDFSREAIREKIRMEKFKNGGNGKNPRRVELALNAFATLMEKGPEAFFKALREEKG